MLRAKLLHLGQKMIESGDQRGAWYLAPFSWIYACVMFIRNRLYDLQWISVHRVRNVVVSVGNIVAGGTGKTPFVLRLAETFSHRKVAILSRGYGTIPDEARLLARRLPFAKVYVGKDRVALARQASWADLIILDDGFQHRRLHRDLDIVLAPHGKEHYLPRGFLRDSPQRLSHADFVFGNELRLKVKKILSIKGELIPSIEGWKVAIFCGIAKPYRFKKTVESLGAEVLSCYFWGDHEVADLAKLPQCKALICTEKDFVKLPPTDLPIYYLQMEMEIAGDQGKWEKLVEKIDQKIDNRSKL